MARASTNKNYFSFVKGLITEANPLTYPEGATLDESNMDLKVDGSRVRRLGIDYELNYGLYTVTGGTDANMTTWASDVFEWHGVAGLSDKNNIIVQQGRYLYVYQSDIDVISNKSPVALVDLATFKSAELQLDFLGNTTIIGANPIADDRLGDYPVDICYGGGRAYVVSANTEPFYIEYHTNTGQYSTHQITQTIRDMQGVDDGYTTTNRIPVADYNTFINTTAYKGRQYNLLNQGWNTTNLNTYITSTLTAPSNADVWTYGKDANDVFQPAWLNKQDFGNTPAPKGRYIHSNYYYSPMDNVYGTGTNTATYRVATYERPSTCAYYAGRLWTAGVSDSNHSGEILFSRVIETASDAGMCYQLADPTSEIISALQPDDGGTIRIPETGVIHRLVPIANGIAVVAKNGVWLVRGAVDGGFTADTFSVVKVTSVGTDSPKTVIEVEGSIMYAARAGLYVLTPNRAGTLDAQNMTQTTVQSEYTKIPYENLRVAKAVFDSVEREVKLYYNNDPLSPIRYWYNEILTFDTRLSAFYRSTVAGDTATAPYIRGVFTSLNVSPTGTYKTSIRHSVVQNTGNSHLQSIAIFHDTSFYDWVAFTGTGVDAPAYFETGYEIFGDAMRNKQVDYIFVYMNRTELTATNGVENNQSSCKMQVKFDWTDNTSAQKWTTPIEVYKYQLPYLLQYSATNPGTENIDYGFSVLTKKEKVRGTGKSIRIRFESSPGKDMQVLGWAISTSGETAV